MTTNEPIRMSDVRRQQAKATTIDRGEAERQFRFSFALVVILTLATVTAAISTRIGPAVHEAGPATVAMKVS